MHFLLTILPGAALVARVLAQSTLIAFTSTPIAVVGGATYNITYAGGDGISSVTMILRKGDPSNLDTIETITTNANGGYYLWAVPKSLPAASDYALQILQGLTNINYSGRFSVAAIPDNYSSASSAASANTGANVSSTASEIAASMVAGTMMARNTTFSSMALTSTSTSTSTSTLAETASTSRSASTSTSATDTAKATATASSGSINGAARMRGSVALVAGALGAVLVMYTVRM